MSPEKSSENTTASSKPIVRQEPTSDIDVLKERLDRDPRFNPPTPSLWKRIALLVTIVVLFYVAVRMRVAMIESQPPKVVHASRYSKEYKFRPAASPIVTEQLKDGRVRVRGAHPTIR